MFIDPKEVKAHLDYLGYHDVGPDQLKDFIKDLKKLVKYSERKTLVEKKQLEEKRQAVVETVPSQEAPDSVEVEPAREPVVHFASPESSAKRTECQCHHPSTSEELSFERLLSARNLTVEPVTTQVLTGYTCTSSTCSSSPRAHVKKENIPPKRISSFIRSGMSDRSGKTDPVTLYHYYQSIWSQQSFPGDPRADVRWRIRHKMMGPHPPLKVNHDKVHRPLMNPPWVE